MIIRQNKGYEINPLFPNSNFYPNENNYVVEDGSALANKIVSLYPNYDFVLDANGNLTDVTAIDQSLDQVKQAKIAELNQSCNQAIVGRFTSTVNGVSYQFSYDQEAQSNFNGTAAAFSRSYITSVVWTAYDVSGNAVRLTLSATDFDTVAKDALNHVNSNISRFRDTLVPQVNSATTVSAVNAIVW